MSGFSRRRLIGTGLVAGGSLLSRSAWSGGQNRPLDLTLAGYPFDHVRALTDGRVEAAGVRFTYQPGKIGDLNTHVFSGPRTLDVTEIGLSPFLLAHANENFRAYSLIPVFPLRLFRHKSIFIHADRGIRTPEDLKGRKIGTPGYSSTSLTWIRGIMQHEYGVSPKDVHWVISTADSSAADAGKVSAQESLLPDNISVSTGPAGKDESQLLLDGDVDALFHAGEPSAFSQGHPKVRRLFEDSRSIERDYFRRTGIFPIMHAVAIRNDLIDAHPWLPEAVFNAYSEAKSLHYESLREQWLFGTLPWFLQEYEETRALMGMNFWPYGIDANRKALDALFLYSYEQGLAEKHLTVEELFHPSTLHLSEKA